MNTDRTWPSNRFSGAQGAESAMEIRLRGSLYVFVSSAKIHGFGCSDFPDFLNHSAPQRTVSSTVP